MLAAACVVASPGLRAADYAGPLFDSHLHGKQSGLTCEGGRLCPEWRALILKCPHRFMVGSDTWVNQRWSA